MKRDPRVVHRVLDWVESNVPDKGQASQLDIRNGILSDLPNERKNALESVVDYHIALCLHTGYLRLAPSANPGAPCNGLSWLGHDQVEHYRVQGPSAFDVSKDAVD